METPPSLPRSLRSRVLAIVIEVLFVGYLAGGLIAAVTSALLVAVGCHLVFDLWFSIAFMAGLSLQACKLGTLLFVGSTDRRMARLAYGLLITLSLVTTCAAIIEALHIPLPGAVGIALLAAAAIEATLVSTFLSLRRRAEASLAQVDLLDGVAREATTLFRRQEARHSALKHEAAGHVQALRTGLRTGESPASQAPIPSPIATPALDDSQCL